MKQEILCPGCAEETRGRLGLHEKNYPSFKSRYQGEYIKLTWGIALNPYLCDLCAKAINQETLCAAFSIWTDRTPFIHGWEEHYIDPIPDKDVTNAVHATKRMKGTP